MEEKRDIKKIIKKLIANFGVKFSKELGIDLSKGKSREIFKWFLASKLFGARIGTNVAIKTYKEFERCSVLSPKKIIVTGWDGLMKILDDGGYVRYDFSTATNLLEIMQDLKGHYGGDLNNLYQKAGNEKELEELLKGLGKGIGDVTVNIFLRELRLAWPKAKPELSELAKMSAGHMGLIKSKQDPLPTLEHIWFMNKIKGYDFCDFEVALVKLGKDYCKKLKCNACPMGDACGCKRG